MDGVAAMVKLLLAASEVTSLVPADRIRAGALPLGTALPAISVMSVSTTDRNGLAKQAKRHVAERIQVTIMGGDYPTAKAIKRQVRRAAAYARPAVAGIENVVVLLEGAGPDFVDDESGIHMQTQDFGVTLTEPS